VRALLELARPEQWIKNGFVLLPLIFGQALGDAHALRGALFATIAFCFLSSAVYAGNDVVDVERDRRHAVKCTRPIARGDVTPAAALGLAVALAAIALSIAAIAGGVWLVATLAAYLALQIAYSLALKHVAYLGALVVATGFLMRIVAGGIGADVPLTPWIVALGFLLAFLLALGKRHGDLLNLRAEGVGLRYDRTTLERIMIAIGAATFTAYVLYTLSPVVLARHGHHPLVFSTPWVALGLGRYLKIALRNPVLLLADSGWLVTLGLILYR
jgi:4-hydroxybenzoate polyprenyltransferase